MGRIAGWDASSFWAWLHVFVDGLVCYWARHKVLLQLVGDRAGDVVAHRRMDFPVDPVDK